MENEMFSEETDVEELGETFNRFDNDQSGYLSANEMSSEDASDKTQPEMSYSNLQYNGISYDKSSAEDLIGIKFDTVKEAHTFYYAYAKVVGFYVRKDEQRTSSKTGRVTIRKWVYSAEGERRVNDNSRKIPTPKKVTRFGCPCLLKIRYFKKFNSYCVVDFKTDHSHVLVQPQEAHLMRSHRFISDSHLALATSMWAVSIKTSHAYQLMTDVLGGIANVDFTPKDLHNRLGASRRETVQDGDAEAVLAYFKGKSVVDKELFCKYSTDENNILASIFCGDHTSLLDYR